MYLSRLLAISTLFAGLTIGCHSLAQGHTPIPDLPTYDQALAAEQDKPTYDFHGEATLWYYRPQQAWIDENFKFFYAALDFDSTYQDYGFHGEFRATNYPFRGYYPSNFWFQEMYGYYRQPDFIVKVGKEYLHFGRVWDGSYYGNILYFDGLKLSPEDGISWEGKVPNLHGWQLNYYAQYFVIDGITNGSLDPNGQSQEGGPGDGETGTGAPGNPATGRDTVTIPGSYKRNQTLARIEPVFKLGGGELTLGTEYEYLLADINSSGTFVGRRINVHRYGVDIGYTRGNWTIFFEWDHQHGQTVIDFPEPGAGATRIDYFWTGTSWKTGKWLFYYNFSQGFYHDEEVYETAQVPGFSYDFRKYFSLAFEYGYWNRTTYGVFATNDNSLNLYLKGAL